MANNSIVIELQRQASDSSSRVSDVLRKALLVATKLKLADFKRWIELELHGYKNANEKTPDYRIVRAAVMAMNPYRGMIPVQMEDSETENWCSRTPINNALPELENMAAEKDGGRILQKLPPEHSAVGSHPETVFDTYRVISRNQLVGIIEIVRTMILEWALKLESEGILGDDMSFSDKDKERAAVTPSIHIGQFQGVLGNVTTKNLQIGDYASLHNQLKDAGISQKERNELENILDELSKTKKIEERKSLVQRGMDWVGKNAENLGALATVVRGIFHTWSQ